MKLKIKDIIDFKTDSIKIKPNEIYPVLQCLKIEFRDNYCSITKNGLNAFLKKNIPAECSKEDGTILVNEKQLFNIAEASSLDSLDITVAGSRIVLTSGKLVAITVSDDLDKFPKNDLVPSEWSRIYLEALTAITVAAYFIDEDQVEKQPAAAHIFCKGKVVAACNGEIAFFKSLADEVPEMILDKQIATCIGNFPGAEHASNNSYNFFKSGSLLYGFSKNETRFFDLSPFGNMEPVPPSFSLIKDEIIKFNNICINSSDSKLLNSRFNCKSSSELELIFENPDSNLESVINTIDITNGSGSFKYRPDVMNRLLRSIPSTFCYFYPGKNKYYITDQDKSFLSLIMGVI